MALLWSNRAPPRFSHSSTFASQRIENSRSRSCSADASPDRRPETGAYSSSRVSRSRLRFANRATYASSRSWRAATMRSRSGPSICEISFPIRAVSVSMAAIRAWIALVLSCRALSADSRFSSSSNRFLSQWIVPFAGFSVAPMRSLKEALSAASRRASGGSVSSGKAGWKAVRSSAGTPASASIPSISEENLDSWPWNAPIRVLTSLIFWSFCFSEAAACWAAASRLAMGLEVRLELRLLFGRRPGNLPGQPGTLLAQGLDAGLLVSKPRGVVSQGALLPDEPHHLVAQPLPLGTDAFGPQGAQLVEAGRVQRVRGIEMGKDDRLDLGNEFAADVVVGAEPLHESLRKEADIVVVRLPVPRCTSPKPCRRPSPT